MKFWTRADDDNFWIAGDPSGEMGVSIVKDLGYYALVLDFLVDGKLLSSRLEWIGGSPVQDIYYEEDKDAVIERNGKWEFKHAQYFGGHSPTPEEEDFIKDIKRIGERILLERKSLIEEKVRKASEIARDLPATRPSCRGLPDVREV